MKSVLQLNMLERLSPLFSKEEKALLLVFDDYDLNYPAHYIKHSTAEISLNLHFAFVIVACIVSMEVKRRLI